jgi:hypothetical protein
MKYKLTFIFASLFILLCVSCYLLNLYYPLTYVKVGAIIKGVALATLYLAGKCWYDDFMKAKATADSSK